jgi:hypothetical protein
MHRSAQGDDPGAAAACIADICAALQSAELAEGKTGLAAYAAVGGRLDARSAQIEDALARIEARLVEVEQELVALTRPSWPF